MGNGVVGNRGGGYDKDLKKERPIDIIDECTVYVTVEDLTHQRGRYDPLSCFFQPQQFLVERITSIFTAADKADMFDMHG